MKPLIRRTFCPKYGAPFGFVRKLRFHLRNYVGVYYSSKFKCNYCPMTFPKKSRAFHAHEDECKMYADATKRKLKEEAKETAKPKTKAGKSGTGPDFVLDNGRVRLCACASETLLSTVLAPSVGLTSESAANPDLFGAAKETPQPLYPQ